MSHPIHWLYQQCMGAIPGGQAQCYLCGIACPPELTVAKGIADTFNSHYIAKVPSSLCLCAACQWYFDSKAGHPDFRKMSLIVAAKAWHNWQRSDMKMEIGLWVSHGLEADAYLIVSLSKKKHILLQAPLNSQRTKLLAIQVEEQVAHIDQTTWHIMTRSFMRLLELGHNKGEVLSGNLYGNTLRKHGQYYEALKLSEELALYRNSAALDLLSYVTIVAQESESESDRTERNGEPASIPGGARTVPISRNHAASSLARSELGHLGQAQKRHLANLRDTGSQRGQDDIQLPLFPE